MHQPWQNRCLQRVHAWKHQGPGVICLLVLSILYTSYRNLTIVQSLFFGLKPGLLYHVVLG